MGNQHPPMVQPDTPVVFPKKPIKLSSPAAAPFRWGKSKDRREKMAHGRTPAFYFRTFNY
jgi:hypothetical protein